MSDHKFLFDNDSLSAAQYFPARRVVSQPRAGLRPDSADSDVVEAAWDLGCVVVTANGDDFEREFRRFLRASQKKNCHDLYGLVVIPSHAAIHGHVLPKLEQRLRLDGIAITWEDVWWRNLLVRVQTNGAVEVRKLGRCFYCERESRRK